MMPQEMSARLKLRCTPRNMARHLRPLSLYTTAQVRQKESNSPPTLDCILVLMTLTGNQMVLREAPSMAPQTKSPQSCNKGEWGEGSQTGLYIAHCT